MRPNTITPLTITAIGIAGTTASADIVNGGLEQAPFGVVAPQIDWGAGRVAFHQDDIPGWSTSDSRGHIEVWSSGPGTPAAAEGAYYAELNAHGQTTMWTTATADAGSLIHLTFAHRGRSGADPMRVDVTDTGADGLLGTGDDLGIGSITATTGNRDWDWYDLDLGRASGNNLVISFSSVSSAGGGSYGNFFDAVRLSQSPAIPAPTTALLAGFAGLGLCRRRRH